MTKSSDKSDQLDKEICTLSNPLPCLICKKEGGFGPRLSLSQYCWQHMPEEEKANFKKKVEDWHNKGKSLKEFFLSGADLAGINLEKADLSGARLWNANLSGARLWRTDLSAAHLVEANLSEADLWKANLSRADLWRANLSAALLRRANLSAAHLFETNLPSALFREADLSGADLRRAHLSAADLSQANLGDAILSWADLTNVKGLRISCFNQKLSDDEKNDPEEYRESYLFVKNYFLKMGLYDDASEAAYQEKVLQRFSYSKVFWREMERKYKERGLNLKKSGWGKFLQRIRYIFFNFNESVKTFFRILVSRLFSDLCGYGERPLRTVRAALQIILAYAVFYLLLGKFQQPQGILGSLYFSVVTFTTLGLGDIKPIANSTLTQFLVASEAFIGAFIIALFVWTLANRGAAR